MQPNSSTSPSGHGPSGRSFLLIIGGLFVAIAVIGAIAVSALSRTAPAAAAAPAKSDARARAAATPEPAPQPTPAPEGEPLEFRGTGPYATDTIHVPAMMRIVMTNSGAEHFSVKSVDDDGSLGALYANDYGKPFAGSAAIAPGDHILQIDSDSDWTIRIEPLK
jgi:hypothetical protein